MMILTLIFSIIVIACIYSAIFDKNTEVNHKTQKLSEKYISNNQTGQNSMKNFPFWVLILAFILEIILIGANKSASPNLIMTPLDYVTQYVVLCGILLIIRTIVIKVMSISGK